MTVPVSESHLSELRDLSLGDRKKIYDSVDMLEITNW